MAGLPTVLLSVLGLTLLCSSVLGQSAANSIQSAPSAPTPGPQQPESPATEPSANRPISATQNTSAGVYLHGNVTPSPDSSNRTAEITEGTTPVSATEGTAPVTTTAPTAPGGTDGGRREATDRAVPTSHTGQSTAGPSAERQSRATAIVVSLVVLIVFFLLLLYVLFHLRNRRWARCVWQAAARAGARVRAALIRMGVWLWPGKSGGLGGEEDEGEEEDKEGAGREGDVELGNGTDAEAKEEKRKEEEGEEEDDEEDSSDDYSSMEGFDLRERARQRQDEEGGKERGKSPSQNQGEDEEEEEEGKSVEATLLVRSKEGGMEECDLTAL